MQWRNQEEKPVRFQLLNTSQTFERIKKKKKGEQQKKSFVELTLSFGIRHCSGEQSQGHTNNERRPASHEGKNKSPPPKNKNGE